MQELKDFFKGMASVVFLSIGLPVVLTLGVLGVMNGWLALYFAGFCGLAFLRGV
jgi:hypothetical protein